MKKKLFFILMALVLLAGLFAPVVRQNNLNLAAKQPAGVQVADGTFFLPDFKDTPHLNVGWNT